MSEVVGTQGDGVTRVSIVRDENGENHAQHETVDGGGSTNVHQVGEQTNETQEQQQFAGKFNSAEDLEKAYLELQSKFSQRTTQETTDSADQPESDVPNQHGEIFEKATNEWSETGQVTDETIQSIEALGIPRAFIDQFVANSNAQAELTKLQVLSEVGGEAGFERISTWAQANLSQEEIQGFNNLLESGDVPQIKLVLGSLKARMGSTNFVQGERGTPDNVGFSTRAEMAAAMADPRYGNDPKFRAEVERKVMKSSFL